MKTGSSGVQIWEEEVTIPTYETGEPNPNPMFLERRVFQGSSGDVYPFPVIESVADEATDRRYRVVFLENRYLKVMIMPELGGRIQMAVDKTNGYHFIYHNSVIKPALVGLAGPWVAGGIEFNWPQHHRPSTFSPVNHKLETHEDGGATVWLGEIERQNHTFGAAGVTLYPDRAYIEVRGRVLNRTPFPQSFLWWANPAVHVNESYQSVFPPDVTAVMDHGKRDVSSFPIARSTYYKIDYSAGVDISFYRNIPVPTSYMAYHSNFDFVGGYDHDRRAGMLHVADHHVSPGKKMWTWGNGDFGKAWERHLTDKDGPYIELMTGVFTDNQPDFTWLAPYEGKRFTQVFLPYKEIGYVRQASADLLIAFDRNPTSTGEEARIGVYATSPSTRSVRLVRSTTPIYEASRDIGPEAPFVALVPLAGGDVGAPLRVEVLTAAGRVELAYETRSAPEKPLPEPARDPGRAIDIKSIEELYLAGLHLEQYRHATRRPEDYYLEMLRRDPGNTRANGAFGRLLLRRGLVSESETYLRKAIERLTSLNANPANGEHHFNLGLCLRNQGRLEESYDAFSKSAWSGAWQGASHFELARIDCRCGRFDDALEHLSLSLLAGPANGLATHLRAAVLRRLGRAEEAQQQLSRNLAANALDFGSHYELARLDRAGESNWENVMGPRPQTYLDLALDYAEAGFYEEACDIVAIGRKHTDYPMLAYYDGYFRLLAGGDAAATSEQLFLEAESLPRGTCFPDRIASIVVLEAAAKLLGEGRSANAHYYLGNLRYSKRDYSQAVREWTIAASVDPTNPTARRNLAIASFNKRHDNGAAVSALENAVHLAPDDARLRYELDLLYKRTGISPAERLSKLDLVRELCEERDDLYIELVHLYNCTGGHEKALELLGRRSFCPWEGGEGKVAFEYVIAHQELARSALENGRAETAVGHLRDALQYPPNLGEGKLPGSRDNDVHYLLARAFMVLEDVAAAENELVLATRGEPELGLQMFYNDQPADMLFYMGLAFRKLGDDRRARECFTTLVDYRTVHRNDEPEVDFFAVSLPDFSIFDEDLGARNRAQCDYLAALGNLGLGDCETAETLLRSTLRTVPDFLRAIVHLRGVHEEL